MVTDNKSYHCWYFAVDLFLLVQWNCVISVVPHSASWIHSCEHFQKPSSDWATRFTPGANQKLHVMLTLIQNKKHTSVHVPPLRPIETQTHVQAALVTGVKPKTTIQCDGEKNWTMHKNKHQDTTSIYFSYTQQTLQLYSHLQRESFGKVGANTTEMNWNSGLVGGSGEHPSILKQ